MCERERGRKGEGVCVCADLLQEGEAAEHALEAHGAEVPCCPLPRLLFE